MVLGIEDAFPAGQDYIDSALRRVYPPILVGSCRVGSIERAAEEGLHFVPLLFDINHQYFFVALAFCQIRNKQGKLLRTTQRTGVLLARIGVEKFTGVFVADLGAGACFVLLLEP